MKSVRQDGPVAAPFPKLMKGVTTSVIVLFTKEKEGTVVNGDGSIYKTGHHSDQWAFSRFEEYHGTVTLSND